MSGSRSQTPASASSGPSRYTATTLNDQLSVRVSPRRSGDTEDTASNPDNGRRRHRQETSAGGFLLDSLTTHSRASPPARRSGSLKGKGRQGEEDVTLSQRHSLHEQRHAIGGSPRDPDVVAHDGDAARQQDPPGGRARPASYSPYMSQNRRHDATQLVNIALQLNQTRQRQASARFRPPVPGTGLTGRVVSSGSPVPLANAAGREVQHQSTYDPRKLAVGAVIANGLGTQQQDSVGNEGYIDLDEPAALEFFPSPQTLIRSERAKIALELKYHHRRVLQHLPRLPPPKDRRPGTARTTLSEGSSTSVVFGRAYNPLQYARNRRIRMQKRCPLDPEQGGWSDLERVKAWVDEVAAQRHVQVSSIFDNYPLPYYGIDNFQPLGNSRGTLDDTDHAKPNNRVPLPPNDWMVVAPDLFADLYWLQEDGNRHLVEDHNGDKLFPAPKDAGNIQANPTAERRRSIFDLGKRSSSIPRKSTDSARGSVDVRSLRAQDYSPAKQKYRERSPKSSKPSESKGFKAPPFSQRSSRTDSVSSSEQEKGNRHKFSRPWSKTFGKHWEGPSIPGKLSTDLKRQSKEVVRPGRPSLEAKARGSRESRRPVSIELHPPEEDKQAELSKQDTFSDLDSTAPNSPIQAATVPSFAVDFDPEKIFGSPPSKRSKDRKRADRHHGVEPRDFAEDPFRGDDQYTKPINLASKAYTTALSSPSETSFSAGSDGRQRPVLKRHETERMPSKAQEENSFRVPKPWKAGKYVAGRVGDLLRRKDYASDTSETDEDSRRNGLKLELSRATTVSTDNRGTLSRSSTMSGLGDSPGYRPPEMPSFSPVRREGPTSSPSRIKTSESISQRLSKDTEGNGLLSPASIGLKSPSRSLTPQLSRMASTEGGNDSEPSRQVSTQTNGSGNRNGRRGATVKDASGQQWPPLNRSNASAWPGEDSDIPGKVTWTGPELKPTRSDEVTESDIFRVEAVLRSICVKAAHAAYTFQCIPKKPGPLLLEVQRQYDADQQPVVRLEEARIISQHLAKHVDDRVESLNQAAETFITESVQRLDSQLEGIKLIVQDKLTGMVLVAGDNADGLGYELSSGLTREVRDINDSIDQIIRARRRRNRLLRRALFQILEWIIMAVMWAVWLIVVTLKTMRGMLKIVVAIFRWLLLL